MKIRSGFVSNSSSSSFIIAHKKERENFKVKVEVDIGNLIEKTICTDKELEEYILDKYVYWGGRHGKVVFVDWLAQADDYEREEYKKILAELKKGRIVSIGSVSNEDGNSISEFLYGVGSIKKYLIDKKNVKVLRDIDV